MPLDPSVLAELRATKAQIDELQVRLRELVASLQAAGATAQEIAAVLRGDPE